MWHCENCGRDFANRNQAHSCGKYSLDEHFAGKSPAVRELFDEVVKEIESISPRNHVHAFRLSDRSDIDGEFRGWLAEAYLVGEQRHLGRTRQGDAR